jgi:hypothetical protein
MCLIKRTFAALAFLLVLGVAGAVPVAFGQEAVQGDQRIYEVRTSDGARYYGYLQVDAPERIVLRTPGGATIELVRTAIVSIRASKGRVVGQEFRPEDPNPTRLFFGPTGRSLKKGEAYFGVYELILPFVQYGVTDWLSIGGGTPLVFGGDVGVFYLTPKVRLFESPSASVSVGTLSFLSTGEGGFGVAYVAGTFGSRDSAVTVGLGHAYDGIEDDFGEDDSGAITIMIGGEVRISRRLKFITENHFLDGGALLSGGLRFLGETLSADIGLFAPSEGGIALPMLNFVWKIK